MEEKRRGNKPRTEGRWVWVDSGKECEWHDNVIEDRVHAMASQCDVFL